MTEYKKLKADLLNKGINVMDKNGILIITAPKNKVFASYFTHDETIHYTYDGWTKLEAYKKMTEIIQMGLIDCDDKDCEFCNS